VGLDTACGSNPLGVVVEARVRSARPDTLSLMAEREGTDGNGRWPLFAGVSAGVVQDFLSRTQRRRFAKGEVIFHEGDPGDSVHLVDRGTVAIRSSTPLGEVTTLALRGPGDYFGELALIGPPEPRSATVVALSACETLVLRRATMAELLTHQPAVLSVLVAMLANRVRTLNAQLLESRFVAADIRIRRRILELCDRQGDPKEVIMATQDELAGLAGTTRGTVNRVLRDEVKRGTISTARGRILVIDRTSLARRAHL
jgi:CRP/FNR family transcriptional regulator, cyclic AMP receptor protein